MGIEDFLSLPLLVSARRQDAWKQWFAAAGISYDESNPPPRFGHFLILAQTAAVGGGATLLQTILIERELANGELLVPFDLPLAQGRSYYFVVPSQRSINRAVSKLKKWIIEEVATSLESCGEHHAGSDRTSG